MNIFLKAFCRAVQTAFRVAMPVLPYRESVWYKSIEEPEKLEKMFAQAGIHSTVYDQVRPNPTV